MRAYARSGAAGGHLLRTLLGGCLALLSLTSSSEARRRLLPKQCQKVTERFWVCGRRFESLRSTGQFSVHLPADFYKPKGRRWPVIMLLHGAGRDNRTLWENTQTRLALESCRSVIVMPNGKLSWWYDSGPGAQYQTLSIEMLDWLTPKLGLTTKSERRAAAGWSMGGFGSLRLIQQFPDRFSTWGGIMALTDFPNPAYPAEQNHSVPSVFGDSALWPPINPMNSAVKLTGKNVWFVTGADAFERSMNETFHRRLMESNIRHEFLIVDGGHKFDVVVNHLPQMLSWIDQRITEGMK